MSWEGWTDDGQYGLRIEATVLLNVDGMCSGAGDRETGGILVGSYSPDRSLALVKEATPPPLDSRWGRSWFKRGVTGLRELLLRRWRARESTYYLGEWHYHPASIVVPSTDDFSQMTQIARAADYNCREPLLVIFGAARKGDARLLRAFVCQAQGEPAELLVRDGELRPMPAVRRPV